MDEEADREELIKQAERQQAERDRAELDNRQTGHDKDSAKGEGPKSGATQDNNNRPGQPPFFGG